MKRKMILFTLVMSIFMIVAACGKEGDDNNKQGQELAPDPGANSVGEKVDATAPEKAELTFFTIAGETVESFDERFGDPIRKKYPNYTINYIRSEKGSTLPELLAAGTVIDVYYDSIGNLADGLLANQLQYDMSDLIKQFNIDLNRYEPTLIDAIREISDGKIYGLPVINNNLALFYNKGVFETFGLSYPSDGMLWDETLDLAKKLNRVENDQQYLGLAVSTTHMLRMNQFSLPYVDPGTSKPTINTDDRWKQLYNKTMIDPAMDVGYQNKLTELKRFPNRVEFHDGQFLGMFVFLSQLPFTVPDQMAQLDWDLVSLPTFNELPKMGSQSYPSYFSVTTMSKQKEAAMEVVKFLGSDEYQMEASRKGTMPVLVNESIKQAYASDTIYKDQNKNFAAVFYNDFAPISAKSTYDGVIERVYNKNIVPMASGQMDINTGFREAEEEANQAIAEANR